jgi:hypothetical protein
MRSFAESVLCAVKMSWSHKAADLARGESLPEKARAVMEMKVVGAQRGSPTACCQETREKPKIYDTRVE